MQFLPFPTAEPTHGSMAGGGGKQCHDREGGKPDDNKGAFDDRLTDGHRVKAVVEADETGEMQAGIEEGQQAEHPPQANQPVLASDGAQG